MLSREGVAPDVPDAEQEDQRPSAVPRDHDDHADAFLALAVLVAHLGHNYAYSSRPGSGC